MCCSVLSPKIVMPDAYICRRLRRMKITHKASDEAEYIELFGSSTGDRHARRRIYRRTFDYERVPCYDLLIYLPHPNRYFAIRSHLDRQWSPPHSYRPLLYPPIPTPVPRKISYIYNNRLKFILVSFCTAYIIVTFSVMVRVNYKLSPINDVYSVLSRSPSILNLSGLGLVT